MKYYLLVGEASGDLHASNLMKALQRIDQQADFRFWGGDLMKSVGGDLVVHYKDRAFMGFAEVLGNLRKILRLITFCKKDISEFQPDVLILVDNSGFNLRIAKWAKDQKIRTDYYISPQVWASRSNRINRIKRDIDNMYVILPFEEAFYKKHDYEVSFVGHPLLDAIADRNDVTLSSFKDANGLSDKPIIALLPGSRKQEITKMLSVMLKMVSKFKAYQFVIAGAPGQDAMFYQPFVKNHDVKFVSNKTYELLSVSYAALVTSGTATLETALFKVPQVVCYKASTLSYLIAKRIITLEFISLVNLIMGREVVTELIQKEFTEQRLEKELHHILDEGNREKLFEDYYELEQKLGGKGASENAARLIYNQ